MTPVILFLLELLSCIKVSTDSKAIDRTFLKWIEGFFFLERKHCEILKTNYYVSSSPGKVFTVATSLDELWVFYSRKKEIMVIMPQCEFQLSSFPPKLKVSFQSF